MSTLIPRDRDIHINLQVGRPDGITWVDLTRYLKSARVSLGDVIDVGTGNQGVDGVVRKMSFTLRNDGPNSFAPKDQTSAWNLVGGNWTPLLWSNREVILQVAITDPGAAPLAGDWVYLFHGVLGESIRCSSDGAEVFCEASDLARRLQRTWIETARTYGTEEGVPVETVMQQILNDNGWSSVVLYCPVSPGFNVTHYIPEFVSVWDALQKMASQIGWYLGYRWDAGTSSFRLTLMEPPRTKDAGSADFMLTEDDDYYKHELDMSDDAIRNAITIYYKDAAGAVQSVTVTDAASIAEYGRLPMGVGVSDTSLINTAEEATDMANAALADLKDQTSTTRINMPLLPEMDLFAGIVVESPRTSSTNDFYGVMSVEHYIQIDDDGRLQARTEVTATGKVIGARAQWLRMQTRPGAKPVTDDPFGTVAPPTPNFVLSAAIRGLTLDIIA